MRNKTVRMSLACMACLGVLCGAVSVWASFDQPIRAVVVGADGQLLPGASVVYTYGGDEAGQVVRAADGSWIIKSPGTKFVLSVKDPVVGAAKVEVQLPEKAEGWLVITLKGDSARANFVKAFDAASPARTTAAMPTLLLKAPSPGVSYRVEAPPTDPRKISASKPSGPQPAGPSGSRQGGEDCGSATVVAALPFSDTGTTVGYLHDYDEVCPYDTPGSPDVVYSYTPGSNTFIDVDLCASAYDTKLYIYEGGCPGNLIACNDDACGSDGYKSALYGVELFSGLTYYIIVDGYGGDMGDYAINIIEGAPPPPGPECPGDSLFAQDATAPEGGWTAGTADENPGYMRWETYSVSDPICDVHFWGLDLWHDGFSWQDCTEDPMPFYISFWTDSGGMPAAEVCSHFVTPTRTPMGLLYAGFEMNLYEVDLPTCCGQMDGWVSIQGAGDPYCWFLWMSSGETGSGSSMMYDGASFVLEDFDLSVCLTGPTGPPGACCPGDGTCYEATESSCTNAGGDWLGEGTFCDPNPCPRVFGACCDDWTGVCEDCVEAFDCTAVTERWAAETLCEDMDPLCGEITGACCMPDSACVEMPPGDCVAAGGEYQGHGVACPANACEMCGLYCPPDAIAEGEPDCGQPDDTVNGGCNSSPPVFGSMACGDTLCGTAVWDGSTRDTDWFAVTVAEETVFTWTATADFPYLTGLVEMTNPGSGDCADSTGYLNPYALAAGCDETVIMTACLPAGEHWFFIAPDFNGPTFACGDGEYTVTIECGVCPDGACCPGDGSCTTTTEPACPGDWLGEAVTCDPNPCPQPCPGDNCMIPFVIDSIPASVTNTTCDCLDDYDEQCPYSGSTSPELVYSYTPTADIVVDITLCDGMTDYDTKLYIYEDVCPDGGPYACNDDACVSGAGQSYVSELLDVPLYVGHTYYIVVDGYGGNCGTYFMDITEDVPPTGRCCYDPWPNCVDGITQSDCTNTYGGSWVVDLTCTADPCPEPCDADTCAMAQAIGALPYGDTGTTCNCQNDYETDGSCPFTSSGLGPDKVYTYTPGADECVIVSLCGSAYDTSLLVYESDCVAPLFACGDDECGVQSELELNLTSGNTYYFVVDGYGSSSSNCGDYVLNVEVCPPPCVVDCPAGGIAEGEACGDDTNGGCNMDPGPPAFEPMNLGDTICGTGWADSSIRDTDWYEVTITEDMILTVTVEGEFKDLGVLAGFVETVPPGTPDCAASTGYLNPYAIGEECVEFTVVTECMPPGTYWPFVAPADWGDLGCPSENDYNITVTGVSCVVPECGNNVVEGDEECDGTDDDACPDECQDDCTCPCPEDTVMVILDTDTYGSETSWEIVDTGTTNVVASGDGYSSNTHYEIEVCVSATGCYDFHIMDSYGDGGAAWEILLNAVSQGSGTFDDGYDEYLYNWGNGCGAAPEGACCFPDGSCVVLTAGDCAVAGGAYEGDDTVCDPNPCPQPTPGDNCGSPNPVSLSLTREVLPYTDSNTTCGRGNDHEDTTDDLCMSYYTNGEDMIYEITVAEAMNVTIGVDPGCDASYPYAGVAIGNVCPPFDDCIAADYHSGCDPLLTECVHLEPGVYYIQVDTWSTPLCIPAFDLTIAECSLPTGACCIEGLCDATTEEPDCTGDWFADETCPDFGCPAPGGDDCTNPIAIALPGDLPYSAANTTCGKGDDVLDGTTCLDGYEGNEDIFFELNVASDIAVDITLTNNGADEYQGILVDDTCPPDLTCIDFTKFGDPDYLYSVFLAAGTYYIMIDGPDYAACDDFILAIDEVPLPPTGACCVEEVCTATTYEAQCGGSWFEGETCPPFVCPACADYTVDIYADLPYQDVNTTCGMVDDWEDTCMGSYDGGEEAIYKLVVEDFVCLDISVDSDNSWGGVALDDSCPPDLDCIATATSSLNPDEMLGVQLDPGTYYVMIDVWPTPECVGYTIDITECAGPIVRGPWDDDDGDGFPNVCDNCDLIPNPDQADQDGDDVGDLCDNCIDVPNGPDLGTCFEGTSDGMLCDDDIMCPDGSCSMANEDGDGDGVGDVCDPCPYDNPDDPDGDGYCSSDEDCPYDPLKTVEGQCGCGVSPVFMCGFNVECDSDGDGVSDCVDLCPGVDDGIFAPGCKDAIPTMSQWGLIVMALLLLVAGKVYFGHRRATA